MEGGREGEGRSMTLIPKLLIWFECFFFFLVLFIAFIHSFIYFIFKNECM